MGQFKPMPKMETTEPSVELKLKKGGKVKKMQMGGAPMMAGAQMPVSPRRRMAMASKAMTRQPMMMRKDGGRMESMKEIEAHERNERDELKRVKKELKSHESMRASKAHKGLKNGGSPAPKAGPNVVGGLAGGLEATRTVNKKMTGGVRAPGYKNGGALNAKGMALANKYQTKINSGNPMPTVKGGTRGLEGSKFKKGGLAAKGMAIARKYETKINSGDPMPTVKGKTGSLEGSKFKNGGHAAMACKDGGGFTAMKKMQKC
jgi:hypothetical protein